MIVGLSESSEFTDSQDVLYKATLTLPETILACKAAEHFKTLPLQIVLERQEHTESLQSYPGFPALVILSPTGTFLECL